MSDESVLAMDIGGGHVTAGLVDGRKVSASIARRSVSPGSPAEALLDTWAATAIEAAGPSGSPMAVGIAIPAPFDYSGGISLMQHKFAALHGRAVGAGLAARWARSALVDVPVVFGNDADLWALGEATDPGSDASRVIGITLGTGLGSGFIADGHVVRTGDDVPPDGEIWNVPFADGIAEDHASGRAVASAYTRRTGRSADAAAVAAAADAGDPDAVEMFALLGIELAAVIRPWALSFGADLVVVGGNVARAFERFGPTLMAGLDGVTAVRCTTLFETATLLGAAVIGRDAAR